MWGSEFSFSQSSAPPSTNPFKINLLKKSYILDNFDRILKHYYYPILKAFVQLLDLFQLVGNQNQVVSPGQDYVYDVFSQNLWWSLRWCAWFFRMMFMILFTIFVICWIGKTWNWAFTCLWWTSYSETSLAWLITYLLITLWRVCALDNFLSGGRKDWKSWSTKGQITIVLNGNNFWSLAFWEISPCWLYHSVKNPEIQGPHLN